MLTPDRPESTLSSESRPESGTSRMPTVLFALGALALLLLGLAGMPRSTLAATAPTRLVAGRRLDLAMVGSSILVSVSVAVLITLLGS